MKTKKPSRISIDKIRMDGGTQVRVMLDDDLIKRYACLMADEQDLDPILLYFDGEQYWLVDGFHRVGAARELGKSTIPAIVKQRSQAQAVWDSLTANGRHGKQLTPADRIAAIKKALRIHPEYTDRRIAKELMVDNKTVAKYRKELEAVEEIPQQADRQGSDGDTYKAKKSTSQEPSKKAPQPTSGATQSEAADDIPSEPTAAESPKPVEPDKDQVGNTISGKIAADFARRSEINALLQKLSEVRSAVAKYTDVKDPLTADLNPSAFQAEIGNCYRWLSAIRPHALCPYCKGDGCRACKDRGWVCQTVYEAAPEDMKE